MHLLVLQARYKLTHTWGTSGRLVDSVPGLRRQCRWWASGQPGWQQQQTGRQCPWTVPAGRPTSSQAAGGGCRPGSPPGGPAAPTALAAGLQLQGEQTVGGCCHSKMDVASRRRGIRSCLKKKRGGKLHQAENKWDIASRREGKGC